MTLLQKLSAITEELGALGKSGSNQKFNYRYVKGEDAMMEFRALEVKHKIKVFTIMRDGTLTITQKESGLITTFVVDYIIADLESEQTYRVSIPVQGYDSTDKGVYKALTGGFKYFLLQTFSYSTDDPEKEVAEDKSDASEKASTSRFKTTPKAVSFKPTIKTDAPVVQEAPKVVSNVVVETVTTPNGIVTPTETAPTPGPKLVATTTFKKPGFTAHLSKEAK